MPRSILEIAHEVCDRVTVKSPETLFGESNDRIARILRVAAKDTLRDLMRHGMKNGMEGFMSQWIFATRPNVYAYQMPPDLWKMLPGTEQRQRWPLGILGPVSPQTWSNWIAGIQYTAVPMAWRIKNNLIHFEPPPVKAEIVVIEYLSNYMVARDATDDDLAPVNGYLQPIAPLIPREGYLSPDAYNTIEAGTELWGQAVWGTAVWGQTLPHTAMRRIPTSAHNTTFPAYQVRAEDFANDTDTCALADDYVLSLGMTWRLRKGLSMPYAESLLEYERERDVMLANDGSRGRTFIFGGDIPHNEIEPLGEGRWLVG